MSRWEGPIDFDKYYGEKEYKKKQQQLEKKEYSKTEKDKMFRDILKYIDDNNLVLYHDLMEDISNSNTDWFNYITFDKNTRKCILTYIKSKAISKYR